VGHLVKSVRVAIFAVLAASKLSAGVYNYVELNTGSPPLFGIVHPPGFTSAGGALDIPVCVAPGDEEVLPALQAAIATWNLQIGITANCDRCRCAESAGSVRPLGVSLESVFLHELGHVLGLDHVNLILAGTSTSFTNAVGTTFVNDGSDNTRGSSDDIHAPVPPSPNPARIIHWFRLADNDPIVVDAITIDQSSFTRARSELPAGHSWPANGNSDYLNEAPCLTDTSELLGSPNTQAVMYSYVNEELVYKWTSADDLNTLRFGMTGMDKMAGTADDYTVEFSLASDCSQAVVEVNLEQPAVGGDLEPGSLAVVIADVTGVPEPPNPTQHFLMRPFGARPRINLRLNDRIEWDYELVFGDGFESGDTAEWSIVVP
jgi:hypothetical protein